MLLNTLKIKNFRALQNFEVPQLGQVNLVVGNNNSGKSTVLEALQIYARQANPTFLKSLLRRHDESFYSRSLEGDSEESGIDKTYQNFFPGRAYPKSDNLRIYIGDVGEKNFVQLAHENFVDEVDEITDEQGEITRLRKRRVISKDQLGLSDSQNYFGQGLLVTSNRSVRQGWIDLRSDSARVSSLRTGLFWEEVQDSPLSHVPTQFVSHDHLASLWDSVALTDGDKFVTRALQIIEPDVQGMAFIQRDSDRFAGRRRGENDTDRIPIVKLRDFSVPVPFNSMGDGLLRLLQLVLALFPARGGFLLIDEFENGLHFSVQQKTWALIFELAQKFNVQVFATTHSWDCIEAFKNVAMEHPNSGVMFRVGKSMRNSDRGKVIATTFSQAELAALTQSHVEVR